MLVNTDLVARIAFFRQAQFAVTHTAVEFVIIGDRRLCDEVARATKDLAASDAQADRVDGAKSPKRMDRSCASMVISCIARNGADLT